MTRLPAIAVAMALLLAGLLDLASVQGTAAGAALTVSLVLASLAVLTVAGRHREPAGRLQLVALALGLASLLLTATLRLTGLLGAPTWGLAEAVALAGLLRVCRPAGGRIPATPPRW